MDRAKRASFIKVRFIIVLMSALCPVVCYMSRQNLSIAMVSMVKDTTATTKNESQQQQQQQHQQPITSTNEVCPAPTIIGANGIEEIAPRILSYGPKYDWSNSDSTLALQSFFWTYVIFQIPAARVAEIVGAKWILATATTGSAVLSLLSPWAASVHIYMFALIRALMGVCQTALYPACYVLFTQWLPPSERCRALPLLGAGAYIGSIIASTTTGYFSEQANLGWEYAFYLPSLLCGLWSIIWIVVGTSEPRDHKFISLEEIEYIESRMEVKKDSQMVTKSLSWKKILKSRHIRAMCAAFLASNWAFTIVLLLLPLYLNHILHIPPFRNGLINSIIYILFVISSPIIGAISTLMTETRAFGLTRLQIRKLFQSTALFGQAACFILIPIIGCDTNLVLIILYTQIVLFSFINGGEVQLPSELSLDFAGTIYAIGNCVGSSTGVIVPWIFGLVVTEITDKDQWNIYFYLAALITSIGGLLFAIFGRNDLQDFATDVIKPKEELYQISIDSALSVGSQRSNKSNVMKL